MRCACCPTGFHAHLIQCVFIGVARGELWLTSTSILCYLVSSSQQPKDEGNSTSFFRQGYQGSERLTNWLRLPSEEWVEPGFGQRSVRP